MSTTPAETADQSPCFDKTTAHGIRIDEALSYVERCAKRAQEECQAALAQRAGAGAKPRATSPAESQITALIRRTTAVTPHGTKYAQKLYQLNGCLLAIERSLIGNPLWQEVTNVEAAPAPALGPHLHWALATMEPELAAARDAVARCAAEVHNAQATFDRWASRPGWLRAAQDWLLQTGQRARDELRAATRAVAAAQATLDEKHARAGAHASEALAAEERADRRRRERAGFQRDVLEIPLREALVEAWLLQETLRSRDVRTLRDAQDCERLQLVGLHRDLGFTVVTLESSTRRYVADWTSLPEPDKALIERAIAGDTFCFQRDGIGKSALKLVELADLSVDHERLEGTVGSTQHHNEQLRAFQLIDASGAARWVRSSQGADLAQELRGDVRGGIVSGAQIRVQNREVHILSRPRCAGFER